MNLSVRKTLFIGAVFICSSFLFFSCHRQNTDETFKKLPAHFIGDRIFVRPVTKNGDTLNLYTDTGGGLFLTSGVVKRLGLTTKEVIVDGDTSTIASLPEFKTKASIPPVPVLPNTPIPSAIQGHLLVFSSKKAPDFFGEGMLGQAWFAKRVWVFDYIQNNLLLKSKKSNGFAYSTKHRIPIYFRTDSTGKHTGHWPRVQAVIEGDTLNFLLDTGATLVLSDSTYASLNDGEPKVRGTSYIISSIFEEWHKKHPEWRVIEHAGSFSDVPIIRVPQVTIAGHTVGPVWFTKRTDKAFLKWMSQYMDKQIVGALGGSLFKYFRMTVNYPKEFAHFELPTK